MVVSYADDLAFLRRMIGKAAAQYFEEAVGPGATVALGGGDTMYEMVLALPQEARDNKLVPAAVIDTGPVLTHRPGGAGDLALGERQAAGTRPFRHPVAA